MINLPSNFYGIHRTKKCGDDSWEFRQNELPNISPGQNDLWFEVVKQTDTEITIVAENLFKHSLTIFVNPNANLHDWHYELDGCNNLTSLRALIGQTMMLEGVHHFVHYLSILINRQKEGK